MAPLKTFSQEITTFAELQGYESAWGKLHAESAQPTAFTTWAWLWNWWKQFGTPGASEAEPFQMPLLLLTVSDERNEPVAMLPLYFQCRPDFGLNLTVLRMLGDREEMCETPSEEPLIVLQQGREQAAIQAIEAHLQQVATTNNWDYASLAFPCFAAAEPQETRKAVFDIAMQRSVESSEEVLLPETYETFRRSLTKSMRDNLTYYPRLLCRRGHTTTVRIVTEPTEIRAATETLIDLHRRRADGTRGMPHRDHMPTDAHHDFQRGCLAELASQGMASIYILEIDGIAVAAQCVLSSSEDICFYYSGFAMDWYDFSPLTILAAEILKDAIEAGTKRVNLLSYAKPWKTRWGARSVERYRRVVLPHVRPLNLVRCATHTVVRKQSRHIARIRERWAGTQGEPARQPSAKGETVRVVTP